METTCRRNLKLKRMGKLEKEQIPDGKETIHIKKEKNMQSRPTLHSSQNTTYKR